jgi:hypothetical protein
MTEDEAPMSLSLPGLDGYGLLAAPSDESHFTVMILCMIGANILHDADKYL